MSFGDIIKNSVLNEFSGELNFERVILSIILSFIIALFIIFIYRVTFRGVLLNKSFALSLVLLSVVTTAIIMTVTSNLALSLGMVGALSIVRFRTAVKDPVDTVYMFWAVCAGIMTGAGLLFWALFANVLIGVLYLVISFAGMKFTSSRYLLTVRYASEASGSVKQKLRTLSNYKLRARVISKQSTELTAEIALRDRETEAIDSLREIPGVIDATLIAIGDKA